MRREINFAIRNIFGTRVIMFTPYMVFEAIVRTQISKLQAPILECVNMVTEELTTAVRTCTQHVSIWLYRDFFFSINAMFKLFVYFEDIKLPKITRDGRK